MSAAQAAWQNYLAQINVGGTTGGRQQQQGDQGVNTTGTFGGTYPNMGQFDVNTMYPHLGAMQPFNTAAILKRLFAR